jgi:hypothetical protein
MEWSEREPVIFFTRTTLHVTVRISTITMLMFPVIFRWQNMISNAYVNVAYWLKCPVTEVFLSNHTIIAGITHNFHRKVTFLKNRTTDSFSKNSNPECFSRLSECFRIYSEWKCLITDYDNYITLLLLHRIVYLHVFLNQRCCRLSQ